MEFPHLISQAVGAYKSRDLAAAEEICRDILEAAPEHAIAHYLRGLCRYRAGDRTAGKEAIEKALSLAPELAAYDMLRDRLIQQGVTEELTHWEERLRLYRLYRTVEAFLISYPKCGRTWLRALLGKYALGGGNGRDPLELYEMTARDPSLTTLAVTHDDDPHWKPADRLFRDKRAYAGKKVIFLVRDPRDAVVSNYFQYTRRGGTATTGDSFDGDLSAFIRHDIGGLESIVGFFNLWAENRKLPRDFLLVSYEEMAQDAKAVLRRCVAFLGWPAQGEQVLDEAVAFASFSNMRKLEESNALKSSRLERLSDDDPESFKVRKGKVGGYRDYMRAEDIAYVDAFLAERLHEDYAMYKAGQAAA